MSRRRPEPTPEEFRRSQERRGTRAMIRSLRYRMQDSSYYASAYRPRRSPWRHAVEWFLWACVGVLLALMLAGCSDLPTDKPPLPREVCTATVFAGFAARTGTPIRTCTKYELRCPSPFTMRQADDGTLSCRLESPS